MKSKFIIALLVASAAFTSCKKENAYKVEGDAAAESPAEPVKENFSVELELVAEKSDDFAVYFTEDGSIKFENGGVVWGGVKANPAPQKVIFDMPAEVIPTNIRIDFGLKNGAEQGDVTLQKVKLSNYGKTFEFKGSDFLKYFSVNDSVKTEIDPANGTIKFLKNPKSTFLRYYYPQQPIVDEISKITK